MAKEKQLFNVFFKVCSYDEVTCTASESDYRFAGETWAVSEKQAINNVRHRLYGDISQYLPHYDNGYYVEQLEWKAVVA